MKRFVVLIIIVAACIPAYAAVSDYLILQDIGPYRIDRPQKDMPGEPPWGGPRIYQLAELKSSYHFQDHIDTVYKAMYLGGTEGIAAPTVFVTHHAGGDSDRWLLHEMELTMESADKDEFGRRAKSAVLRKINNNAVFCSPGRNGKYAWVGNKITVLIEYGHMEDANRQAEPTEIVEAYLKKFPSTIPLDYPFNEASHDDDRARTEVNRRLWLSEKWLAHIQPNDPELHGKLAEVVDCIKEIVTYRERFYRDISRDSAKKETSLLSELLQRSDEEAIRSKLGEYSSWWRSKNK